MAEEYAKRLAAHLINDSEERVTVDVPNDGFEEAVVRALKGMGFQVEQDKHRPNRLTIIRLPGTA